MIETRWCPWFPWAMITTDPQGWLWAIPPIWFYRYRGSILRMWWIDLKFKNGNGLRARITQMFPESHPKYRVEFTRLRSPQTAA